MPVCGFHRDRLLVAGGEDIIDQTLAGCYISKFTGRPWFKTPLRLQDIVSVKICILRHFVCLENWIKKTYFSHSIAHAFHDFCCHTYSALPCPREIVLTDSLRLVLGAFVYPSLLLNSLNSQCAWSNEHYCTSVKFTGLSIIPYRWLSARLQ